MEGGKRNFAYEKLARIYDAEILPIWTERFGRLLLRGLTIAPDAQVLELGCGTGYLTAELLRRMGDEGTGRIIALETSTALLDVARRRVGAATGKRVFFRSDSQLPRLGFAAGVYDLVVSNLSLSDSPEGAPGIDAAAALAEMTRVCKRGGKVVATLPLAGTWGELHDIFREVLTKDDRHEPLKRLAEEMRTLPEPSEAEGWLRAAGLVDVDVEVESFELLFRSSREFFYAPVVEYGPLASWKAIVGKGQDMQDVFWNIKQAIDAYFGDRAFAVTVRAGCLRGTLPVPLPLPDPDPTPDPR